MTNLAEQLRLSFNCSESELALEYEKNRTEARQNLIMWMCAQNGARLWYEVPQREVRFIGLFYHNLNQLRTPDNSESLKEAFEKAGYSIKYPELPAVVVVCTSCACQTYIMAPLEWLY